MNFKRISEVGEMSRKDTKALYSEYINPNLVSILSLL